MSNQHTIESQRRECNEQRQGIIVPLDLAELKILSQSLQKDGSLEVHVIATKDREPCPTCQRVCVKIHDTRRSVKRDLSLRIYQVRLVLYKRRFRCTACQRTFTETESVCGR